MLLDATTISSKDYWWLGGYCDKTQNKGLFLNQNSNADTNTAPKEHQFMGVFLCFSEAVSWLVVCPKQCFFSFLASPNYANEIKMRNTIYYLSQAYPSSLTKPLHFPFSITFTFYWKKNENCSFPPYLFLVRDFEVLIFVWCAPLLGSTLTACFSHRILASSASYAC